MLFHNSKLNRLLFGSLVFALAVPLLNIFLIYPLFSSQLIDNIENAAVRLAVHMENELEETGGWQQILEGQGLTAASEELLANYSSDFDLRKLKIYSAQGMTVYSTEHADIGKINNKDYFQNIVVKGQPYSKLVKKETNSLEGQTYLEDVVEVYAPSMQGSEFNGAFELYYNVTDRIEPLDRLVWYASILPFVVSGLLLVVLYWGMRNLDKSLLAQQKAEEEIKVLQGIIPICTFCKEIRDDSGYWSQLEAYISQHSEAEFSHSICEKCLKEQHGQLFEDDDS